MEIIIIFHHPTNHYSRNFLLLFFHYSYFHRTHSHSMSASIFNTPSAAKASTKAKGAGA